MLIPAIQQTNFGISFTMSKSDKLRCSYLTCSCIGFVAQEEEAFDNFGELISQIVCAEMYICSC